MPRFFVSAHAHLPVVIPKSAASGETVVHLTPGSEIPANMDPEYLKSCISKGLVRVEHTHEDRIQAVDASGPEDPLD